MGRAVPKAVLMLSFRGLAALSTAQAAALTSAQIRSISTANIVKLETEDVAALNAVTVAALTANQIANLTTDQFSGMSSKQIATLSSAQLTNMTTDQRVAALQALYSQLDALLTGPVDQLAARLDHAPGLLDAWDPRGAGARPSNLARNLHHLTSAGAALVLLHHGPARGPLAVAATAIAATAWTLEFTRRRSPAWNALLMRLFGPVAHPDEAHRVNSGTWYATGLAVLACTTPTVPATVALAVLGVGDPVAAQVGRRWGRTRLRDNRTVEGSLACWLAGGTAAWAATLATMPATIGSR
jgi:dolichol kinase